MKKNLAFLLIGLLLAMPITIFGETVVSIIGKEIQGQFPLYINGEKSEKDAVVVDGVSYIPVRAAGELFGYDVGFIDSEVILSKKVDVTSSLEINVATDERIMEISEEISKWQGLLEDNEKKKEGYLKDHPDKFPNSDLDRDLTRIIDNYNAKITDLEAQKAELSTPTEEIQ